jgi:hypothetical protein
MIGVSMIVDDITELLIPFYNYFQYLRSDKRYGDAMTKATISLRMIL